MITIDFFTRKACPLCDDAEAVLDLLKNDFPFHVRKIDIENDDVLHEMMMLRVPVVVYQGETLAEGAVSSVNLYEKIREIVAKK